MEMGEYDKAGRDASTALSRDPQSVPGLFVTARCDIAYGRYESAHQKLHHLNQQHPTIHAIRMELMNLTTIQSLVSQVNQALISRNWIQVYHLARIALSSSPCLSRLRDLMHRAVTEMDKVPVYRQKQQVLMSVRHALDQMVKGKDYCKILNLNEKDVNVTNHQVNMCCIKRFLLLAVEKTNEKEAEDVEEAFQFMRDERRRQLFLDWRSDPQDFDPNDLTCYTLSQ